MWCFSLVPSVTHVSEVMRCCFIIERLLATCQSLVGCFCATVCAWQTASEAVKLRGRYWAFLTTCLVVEEINAEGPRPQNEPCPSHPPTSRLPCLNPPAAPFLS